MRAFYDRRRGVRAPVPAGIGPRRPFADWKNRQGGGQGAGLEGAAGEPGLELSASSGSRRRNIPVPRDTVPAWRVKRSSTPPQSKRVEKGGVEGRRLAQPPLPGGCFARYWASWASISAVGSNSVRGPMTSRAAARTAASRDSRVTSGDRAERLVTAARTRGHALGLSFSSGRGSQILL